ncbi:hypothetical protein HYT56_02375 [Candidatus Woesearchaeota archaeon]|nr:hypothetical protein [Candidatus Woesearchaeota archaeon]
MALLSNKRGIAVTFNWIFSIVAGVLIFSFLVYFAVQNTDLFGNVTARIVAEELDILLSGYETIQTKSVLDFDKNIELEFYCDNDEQKFKINGETGKTVWDKIIFSPDKIEGSKINVATAPWNVPFRAANFIYIWDKKYNIRDDVGTGVELINNLKGSGKNVLVSQYFDLKCNSGNKGEKVIHYNKDTEEGYICFDGKDDNNPIKFFGEAMLIGAVLSDRDNFECAKNNADEKLNIMKKVFENKKDNLVDAGLCEDNVHLYGIFMNKMNTLTINSINKNTINSLDNLNKDLIAKGCASVY